MTNNETVLRQNVADLQAQLAAANERISKMAASIDEAKRQKPVAFWWIGPDGKDNGGPYAGKPSDAAIEKARNSGCDPQLLYAGPVAAAPATNPVELHQIKTVPAVAVPAVPDWRPVMQELADDLSIELDMRYQSRHQYPSEQRKYDNEMALVIKARSLLQSAPQPASHSAESAVILELIRQREDLLVVMRGVVSDIQGLIAESEGVIGLHLNGDIAPWSELEAGGRFDRLTSIPDAIAAIAEMES